METKRSVEITIYGYIYILLGVYCIITLIILWFYPPQVNFPRDYLLDFYYIFIGLPLIWIGVNMLKLKSSARKVSLYLPTYLIGALCLLYFYKIGYWLEYGVNYISTVGFLPIIIPLIVSFSTIFFLNRPKVKEQFK